MSVASVPVKCPAAMKSRENHESLRGLVGDFAAGSIFKEALIHHAGYHRAPCGETL
jgi:hypothetical protein